MRKRIFLISSSGLALFLCLTTVLIADKHRNYPQAAVVYSIPNFHVVAPGVMRGGQPPEKDFKILKDYYDVQTVLSFCINKDFNELEKKLVEGLDMNFISIPMDARMEQSIRTIERCVDIINDESKKPIFVHCFAGKDRTGLIIAAYRIKYDNWSFEDAFKEMLAYGYDKVSCDNLNKSLISWDNYLKREKEKAGQE